MASIIYFKNEQSGKTIGSAQLKGGKLVANNETTQGMIDGKVAARGMDGPTAFRYFSSWSNGYVTSKAG